MPKTNKYLLLAIVIGLIFHGSIIFFTLESTYDALIHLFFADHYAGDWFNHWNEKWYTGFSVMGYPPLVHQAIGALSFLGGLKFGLFSIAILAVVLFTTGVYRFTLLMMRDEKIAGYTALFAVFSSSFIETLHLFGQLPSIIGISLLLHSLPEIYKWITTGAYKYLWSSLALIAVTVTSHHVTPIFGMVFFIFPLIGMGIMDCAYKSVGSFEKITLKVFWTQFLLLFWRIVSFGMGSLALIILCLLPYWINTKNNPITQVPIPHGSRDSFLEVTSSGLVFFLIPWGVILLIMPFVFYRYYSKRYLFFGLSISMLFLLGTGGTTPLPRMILGDNAFDILTLDRFTLWASIMSLPIVGEFIYRLLHADIKERLLHKYATNVYRSVLGFAALAFISFTIFTISLGYFRPGQPAKIEMQPIVNFLDQDQHDRWRYLTLGFGDQMAWLATQTDAKSVDGNYHSARRLPELTTRPVERLENSKFRGVEGLGSLQQFLTVPEKYHLKYVFSNDKFYDPILYFSGWQRLQRLENGILVWEKLNVAPLPTLLPKDPVPVWQNMLWGIIPFTTVFLAILICSRKVFRSRKLKHLKPSVFTSQALSSTSATPSYLWWISLFWSIIITLLLILQLHTIYIKLDTYRTPENVILSYYDDMDFKRYESAYDHLYSEEQFTLDQFMLTISVTDGLLSSYAKLDELQLETITKTDSTARILVNPTFITPLKKINVSEVLDLVKINAEWKIVKKPTDTDLPPDQLLTNNSTAYFNQGRRKISTEQTYHEDVLKQPELVITDARLIKNNNGYFIVGVIQNIDTVPADVVITGSLYDRNNEELARHNARYKMIHKLMPKESTPFLIQFEGIAWSSTLDHKPASFDPDHYTPIFYENPPVTFNIQAAGNVSVKDLSKDLNINEVRVDENAVLGSIFNTGIGEVTIPQLLISYYNADKKIIWVGTEFIDESIRPQRKGQFSHQLTTLNDLTIISNDMSQCFINGLPNSDKITAHPVSPELPLLVPTGIPEQPYLNLHTNSFISNPLQ